MENNFKLITPSEKKKRKLILLLTMIVVLILITAILFIIKINILDKNTNDVTTTTTNTTTSSTTTTITTTTTTKVLEEYVYNYKLNKDIYNIYVCDKNNKRIKNYKLYNNKTTLGVSSNTKGIEVNKNILNASTNEDLTMKYNEEYYIIKYDTKCN